MDQKTLTADSRSELKKNASGRFRKAGKIPAIVYGHSGQSPILVDAHEFSRKFKRVSENTIINLRIADTAYDVLVKDFQEDILTGRITHIDFFEIEQGKALRTRIPVRLRGSAHGVREGGVLEHLMHEIEVECLPKDIPESIDLDVSHLVVGMSIHLSDIAPPENVRFIASAEQVVVAVTTTRAEAAAPEAEAAAEGEAAGGEAETTDAEAKGE